MEKNIMKILLGFVVCICLEGCSNSERKVEELPEEVINPGGSIDKEEDNKEESSQNSGDVLSSAVSAKIGLVNDKSYNIDMYNNAAAETILGYLSEEEMRFPTYTYEEEDGYVAQNIRGSYTRDDEKEILQVKAGELYLFSDGQLRLYFKDVENAGITATPVGCFQEDVNITELVQDAYEENKDDSWGVDVYFLITKN